MIVFELEQKSQPSYECIKYGIGGACRSDAARERPLTHIIQPGLDFMTFFPIVIPRWVLRRTRHAVVTACEKGRLDAPPAGHAPSRNFTGITRGANLRATAQCHFDRAYMALARPCYGDLLGKVAVSMSQAPGHKQVISWMVCPPTKQAQHHGCEDLVPVTEHVKHPYQGAQNGYSPGREGAESVEDRLVAAGLTFSFLEPSHMSSLAANALPPRMFHYLSNRSAAHVARVSSQLMKPDPVGRVCGVGYKTPRVEELHQSRRSS
jgi:hypothetical protein